MKFSVSGESLHPLHRRYTATFSAPYPELGFDIREDVAAAVPVKVKVAGLCEMQFTIAVEVGDYSEWDDVHEKLVSWFVERSKEFISEQFGEEFLQRIQFEPTVLGHS